MHVTLCRHMSEAEVSRRLRIVNRLEELRAKHGDPPELHTYPSACPASSCPLCGEEAAPLPVHTPPVAPGEPLMDGLVATKVYEP